jgi:hypothetical protein
MFHRQCMHAMLKEYALGEEGDGIPAKLLVNHAVRHFLQTLRLQVAESICLLILIVRRS